MCDRGGIELLQSKNENGISFSGHLLGWWKDTVQA
uniref:Uncharacterized protein n=1 Tax=Anabas testudineus TaxID=64144 RepID=A0A7N6BVF4_ANATE